MAPSSALKARMAAFQKASTATTSTSTDTTPTSSNKNAPKKVKKIKKLPASTSAGGTKETATTTNSSSPKPKKASTTKKTVTPLAGSTATTASTKTKTTKRIKKSTTTTTSPKPLSKKATTTTASFPSTTNKPRTTVKKKTFLSPSTRKKKVVTSPSPADDPKSPARRKSPKKSKSPKKLTKSRIATIGNVIAPPPVDPKAKVIASGPRKPKKAINIRASTQDDYAPTEKAKQARVAPPPLEDSDIDWTLQYELALQYDRIKAQEAAAHVSSTATAASPSTFKPKEAKPKDRKSVSQALEGLLGGNYTANGNFLNDEFIDQYLKRDDEYQSLTFDFAGQSKLFKRFERKDAEQAFICTKFVQTLLEHPQSKKITCLHMANAILPDRFLVELASQCQASNGLPNLQVLNLESNCLSQDGILALAQALSANRCWPRLQMLYLENQKSPLGSDAEEALGAAVVCHTTLVTVSLRVRDGLARQQIQNAVAANVDRLRIARRKHQEQHGGIHQRKRNEMEVYFDTIASNADASITSVELVGNIKFLGLNATERVKAGAAFATNTTVQRLKLCQLKLDDAFAQAFGQALALNSTLETVILDSNAFSGTGIKSLLQGLGQNSSIVEFQVRHQSKTTSSSDEDGLPELLASNTTCTKLGIDVRNPLVRMQLDRKMNENREHARKKRAAAAKAAKQ